MRRTSDLEFFNQPDQGRCFKEKVRRGIRSGPYCTYLRVFKPSLDLIQAIFPYRKSRTGFFEFRAKTARQVGGHDITYCFSRVRRCFVIFFRPSYNRKASSSLNFLGFTQGWCGQAIALLASCSVHGLRTWEFGGRDGVLGLRA